MTTGMTTGTNMQEARIVCQLCDRGSNAEWKCAQCNKVMCDDCKTTHVKENIEHTVSTIRERIPSSSSQSNDDKNTDSNCKNHKNKPLLKYCSECCIPICLDCDDTTHKKHDTVQIPNVAESKRKELNRLISQLEEKLSKLTTEVQSLQTYRDDYSKETKDVVNSVETQGSAIKGRVNKIVQGCIDKLQKGESKNKQRLEEVQNKFEAKIKALKRLISDCENKLESKNDASIIEVVESTKKNLSAFEPSPVLSAEHPTKFVAGDIDEANLKAAVGYLEQQVSHKLPAVLPAVSPDAVHSATLVTSFKSPVNFTTCVAAVDKRNAWVGRRWEGKEVVLVSVDGKMEQTVQLDFTLGDIAVTPNGELLATVGKGHHIKRLTKEGKFEDIKETTPFITKGLHVTPDDEVLVCLFNRGDEHGKVTRMTMEGETHKTIQYVDNNALFQDPVLVTQNINNDVCIIDCTDTSESVHTLVVVDKDGKLRFKYTGPPYAKMNRKSEYQGIACDISGCILLSDGSNSVIHTLDIDGRFIQWILTSQDRIKSPWGLSLGKTNQLWICNDGNAVLVVNLK